MQSANVNFVLMSRKVGNRERPAGQAEAYPQVKLLTLLALWRGMGGLCFLVPQ